jgi:hypothetical protein
MLGNVEANEFVISLTQVPTEYLGKSDADDYQKKKLKKLVEEYSDVFSVRKLDIYQYQGIKHHI